MFTYPRTCSLILALVLGFTIKLALASNTDPHVVSAATSSDSDASSTEAKKLYKRYKKAYDKSIVAIACVRDPKCIEPEDAVSDTVKTL